VAGDSAERAIIAVARVAQWNVLEAELQAPSARASERNSPLNIRLKLGDVDALLTVPWFSLCFISFIFYLDVQNAGSICTYDLMTLRC
jgi:hypothetical protein